MKIHRIYTLSIHLLHCICMCAHMPGGTYCRNPRLELQLVVRQHAGAENWAMVLWKRTVLLTAQPSLKYTNIKNPKYTPLSSTTLCNRLQYIYFNKMLKTNWPGADQQCCITWTQTWPCRTQWELKQVNGEGRGKGGEKEEEERGGEPGFLKGTLWQERIQLNWTPKSQTRFLTPLTPPHARTWCIRLLV